MVYNWSIFAQSARRAPERLLNRVAAPRCLLCGGRGQQQVDLCAVCESMLPRPVAMAPAAARGQGCVLAVAAVAYSWPVDQLVQELKFGGAWPVARLFGRLLAQTRRRQGQPLPQAILPVPLHRLRYAERGFNQAEHIARFAAETLQLPMAAKVLLRRRHTAVQSKLDAAARRDNLRGAFTLDARFLRGGSLPWERVALVDDVQTTGSTLAAATEALRHAGVAKVEWWCAARVVSSQPAAMLAGANT